MRILLIGGNSYIARHLAYRFQTHFSLSILKRGDLSSSYFDLDSTRFSGYDAVINCTGIVHSRAPDPILSQRINADLPLFLANQAKTAGVSHFIHFSSVAVYGFAEHIDPSTPEFPETVYGESKLAGDRNLLSVQDASFSVTLIRPPMVYGPNAPGNLMLLIRLIRALPLLPFDYRNNRRSLIYIDNLLNAVEKILATKPQGVVLVRDAQMPSLYELSDAIIAALGLKRRLFSMPESLIRLLDRFRSLPFHKLFGTLIIDDAHSRQLLGEYASIPFFEAIRQTIQKETLL